MEEETAYVVGALGFLFFGVLWLILGLAKEDALEQSFGVGSMFVGLFNLARLSTDFHRFFAKLKRREKIKLGMIDAVGSIMGLALGYVLLGPWGSVIGFVIASILTEMYTISHFTYST